MSENKQAKTRDAQQVSIQPFPRSGEYSWSRRIV